MTQIVYKNNLLAVDSRTTTVLGGIANCACAHCGEKASAVTDESDKIRLPRPSKKTLFNGERLLAYTGTGNKNLIRRLWGLVQGGTDITVAYENHRVFAQPDQSQLSCTALIVTDKSLWIVHVPEKMGSLRIDRKERTDFVVLGACADGARWINRIIESATATTIVNLCMAHSKTIGGPIRYLDFVVDSHEVKTLEKTDPLELVSMVAKVFTIGEAVDKHESLHAELGKKYATVAVPTPVKTLFEDQEAITEEPIETLKGRLEITLAVKHLSLDDLAELYKVMHQHTSPEVSERGRKTAVGNFRKELGREFLTERVYNKAMDALKFTPPKPVPKELEHMNLKADALTKMEASKLRFRDLEMKYNEYYMQHVPEASPRDVSVALANFAKELRRAKYTPSFYTKFLDVLKLAS